LRLFSKSQKNIMKCKQYRQRTRCNNNGLLIITVSSACFGQLFCPKHTELTGSINKPLFLHLVGCLYDLYQRCTIKQVSNNEIYLLIKYIKSFLWRVAKRLSYIEDARCLKVKENVTFLKNSDCSGLTRVQYYWCLEAAS
jgi:hypothetical protein